MYLTELDLKTNLIKDDKLNDAWKAVKPFTDLVSDKKFGMEAFTSVAIALDYLSPVRFYASVDRPAKAMELVTGKRTAFPWANDKIQLACIAYSKLQYDAALEEKRIIEDMRIKKIEEIKHEEDDDIKRSKLSQLGKINKMMKEFESNNDMDNLYIGAPVLDGYELSRLEAKVLNKKSFYYNRKK